MPYDEVDAEDGTRLAGLVMADIVDHLLAPKAEERLRPHLRQMVESDDRRFPRRRQRQAQIGNRTFNSTNTRQIGGTGLTC